MSARMDKDMGKRKQERIVYGKDAHYWPDNMMPFVLAGACVDVVRENSEEAEAVFCKAVEAWGRSDCQAALTEVQLPFGEMMKVVYKTGPTDLPDSVLGIYERNKDTPDCRYLLDRIDEFIMVGFNRPEDQVEGKYKVLPANAPWLCLAAGWQALGVLSRERPDWETYRQVEFQRKMYDPASFFDGEDSNRRYRRQVGIFRRHGWRKRQDSKLRDMSWYWYQCRVIYSGPSEFCRQYLLETGIELRAENIVKEIALCDDAVGYPRKGINSNE